MLVGDSDITETGGKRRKRLSAGMINWGSPWPKNSFPSKSSAGWERMARKWEEGTDLLFYHAPALVLIRIKRVVTTLADVDAGLSAMQMVLMAETMGLGTCLNGFLVTALKRSEELRKVLNISDDHQVHVTFTVGYPDVEFLRLVARNLVNVKWMGDER